jgi:hypothetical protein
MIADDPHIIIIVADHKPIPPATVIEELATGTPHRRRYPNYFIIGINLRETVP